MIATSEAQQWHRLSLQSGANQLALSTVYPRYGVACLTVDKLNVDEVSGHKIHTIAVVIFGPD